MIKIQVIGSTDSGKTSVAEFIRHYIEKYGIECEVKDAPYLNRKLDISDIEDRMMGIFKNGKILIETVQVGD